MGTQLQIPPHEVQRRLAIDNPWWRAGQGIDPQEQAWPRRAYFAQFAQLVRATAVRRAVVLIGPRRVGKTVMLKHLIAELLADGVAGTDILFLSLDTPLYSGRSLESLLQIFLDLHQHKPGKPVWVLFDEVQYLKDWEVHLKSLVDTYGHLRFVASGSAAAALRMKSRESGAGRFTEFILPPLTFAEYLTFAGTEQALIRQLPDHGPVSHYAANNIQALNVEFVNYLNYGGFPEAVMNPAVRDNPARFLRQDIVDKVLLKGKRAANPSMQALLLMRRLPFLLATQGKANARRCVAREDQTAIGGSVAVAGVGAKHCGVGAGSWRRCSAADGLDQL